MSHLSYSFCMSMLHSFWQAGLLLLAFALFERSFRHKTSPLQKRNWLFVLLVAQLSFFIVTFLIYSLHIENEVAQSLFSPITAALPVATIALITPWLFTLYILVLAFKMVTALYAWLQFKRSYHNGLQKPSIDLKLFTLSKANHFGIKRKVQLWFSSTINAPITFGFLKPVIVLPVALVNQISMQQAETLILHELTHIKANDYLLNWTLIIIENIFFFNPFILMLCKKVRLEREKYCDSNVIAFNYSPLLYAETLLQVQQYVPQYQLAAVTGKKQLLQRIQFFTNKKNFTYKKSNRIIFPLVSFIFLTAFGATLFFQYQITAKIAAPVVNIPASVLSDQGKIETASLVTDIISNLTDENIKKIESTVKKQQPVIEKQLEKLTPLIKSVQYKAEQFVQQFDGANLAIPAALKENTPTKQIIVKEEQSGSKNATVKVYTLAYIDNHWVIIPEWMLAAKEIPSDSSLQSTAIKDSTKIINQLEQ